MRLHERTLIHAELAPRIRETGALGGLAEHFSTERIPIRASRIPEGGGIAARQRGAANGAQLRLLVPADVQVAAGDGVWVEGRLWRIAAVESWMAHRELVCEMI